MKKSKEKLLEITGLSNEVFEIIRFELYMFILRLNTKFNPFKKLEINKYVNSADLKVNIGAGPFGEDGWINIDIAKHKNISFTYDCRKKLPFADNTVSKIRCEHLLEHLDKIYELPEFLEECKRVLKKNGVLRIVVPDIEKYINAYYEGNWTLVGLEHNIQAKWQAAEILTHLFRQGGEHKYGYDFHALSKVLIDAGFEKVIKTAFGCSLDGDLKYDQPNHRFHSLYVEAVK